VLGVDGIPFPVVAPLKTPEGFDPLICVLLASWYVCAACFFCSSSAASASRSSGYGEYVVLAIVILREILFLACTLPAGGVEDLLHAKASGSG
jgi:hypothetical protein